MTPEGGTMSREQEQLKLHDKTQQLLRGSLKHVRAAALAAALVPLAAVAATPVHAQDGSNSGGTAVLVVPNPCDFVTSGGFVNTDMGDNANFGAHGGCKNGEFWGHVNYIDHSKRY